MGDFEFGAGYTVWCSCFLRRMGDAESGGDHHSREYLDDYWGK
jgi:hypothetical protein